MCLFHVHLTSVYIDIFLFTFFRPHFFGTPSLHVNFQELTLKIWPHVNFQECEFEISQKGELVAKLENKTKEISQMLNNLNTMTEKGEKL